MDSILNSVKKLLGPDVTETHFDPDIIMEINSALLTCNQLAIGPDKMFHITGDTETWEDFLGPDKDSLPVATFIYLKVRLVFDPPSSSYVLTSIENQIAELEWRLNIQAEGVVDA